MHLFSLQQNVFSLYFPRQTLLISCHFFGQLVSCMVHCGHSVSFFVNPLTIGNNLHLLFSDVKQRYQFKSIRVDFPEQILINEKAPAPHHVIRASIYAHNKPWRPILVPLFAVLRDVYAACIHVELVVSDWYYPLLGVVFIDVGDLLCVMPCKYHVRCALVFHCSTL